MWKDRLISSIRPFILFLTSFSLQFCLLAIFETAHFKFSTPSFLIHDRSLSVVRGFSLTTGSLYSSCSGKELTIHFRSMDLPLSVNGPSTLTKNLTSSIDRPL